MSRAHGWTAPFRQGWPEPADDLRDRLARPGPGGWWGLPGGLPALGAGGLERRLAAYWRWFALALFVWLTLDMVTTLYALEVGGLAGEANPLVRTVLSWGILPFAAVNLLAAAAATAGFAGVVRLLRRRPSGRHVGAIEWLVVVWLGLLLGAGVVVVLNNAAVVVVGRSLVG